MPLVTLSGLPCSGKTTLLKELISTIAEIAPAITCLVYDELTAIEGPGSTGKMTGGSGKLPDARVDYFMQPLKEKELRGQLRSETARLLSMDAGTLVFLDSGNYIKSFRYELFCSAKSLRQQHSVVYVNTSEELCLERNRQLARYPEEAIKQLFDRFEQPNGAQRWDQPLFQYCCEGDNLDEPGEAAIYTEVQPLAVELVRVLIKSDSASRVQPNRATEGFVPKAIDFLANVDEVISKVGEHVLSCQGMGCPVAKLPNQFMPGAGTERDLPVLNLSQLGKMPWTEHSMGRAKQNFLRLIKINHPKDSKSKPALAIMFMRFLAGGADSDSN